MSSLPYRPKFLKRTPFVSIRVAPAPEPHIAPAAHYAGEDPRRPYIPGAVLAYSAERGVLLFRDAPEPAWRDHGRPALPRRRDLTLRILLLQAALLAGALLWGALVPGAGQ